MNNVYVYVATTQGPSLIQKITEEEDDVRSLVCLDGMPEPLPITDRYHDFVKKGSGLIHRDFGHGAFRVDLSERVDQGSSWQLGFYLAHALFQRGQLGMGGQPQRGDLVVWATGAVKTDRSVSAVEKVQQKLQFSSALFQQWREAGVSIVSFAPGSTVHDLPAQCWPAMGLTADNIGLQAVATLDDAMAAIECLLEPVAAASAAASQPVSVLPGIAPPADAMRPGKAVLLVLAIIVLGGAGAWQYLRAPAANAPETPPPALEKEPTTQGNGGLDDFGGEPATPPPGVFEVEAGDTAALRLTATLKSPGASCGDETIPRELSPSRFSFDPIAARQLCTLTIWPLMPVKAVLAIALDSAAFIPLTRRQGVWELPAPKNQTRNRPYAIVLLNDLSEATVKNRLRTRLARTAFEEQMLTADQVQAWLQGMGSQAQVFVHTLTVE